MRTSLITSAIAIAALTVALALQSCTLTVTPDDAIRAFEAINSSRSNK